MAVLATWLIRTLLANGSAGVARTGVLGSACPPSNGRHARHSRARGSRYAGRCLESIHPKRADHPALPARRPGHAGKCNDGLAWSRCGFARQPLCVDLALFACLGAWSTGSNLGGTAMLTLLQKAAASRTGLSLLWLAAAQNGAGQLARMLSPACLMLAATSAGLKGQEGLLISKSVLSWLLRISVPKPGIYTCVEILTAFCLTCRR